MRALLGIILVVAAVSPAAAARPSPTGSFILSDPPYIEGGTVVFDVSDITGVNRNYETTLGIWCFAPDGSQLLIGNRNNPYIYEFNSVGGFYGPLVWDLPINGTGYDCTAQLVVVRWFKGEPIDAWTLETHPFSVIAGGSLA